MNPENRVTSNDDESNTIAIIASHEEEKVEQKGFNKKVFSGELLFFLFKIAEGILEPTISLYLYDSVCLNLFPNRNYNYICNNLTSDHVKEAAVQDMAAKYMSYHKLLINLPAIVMVLCCGVWSDKSERITPIIFNCLGTAMACVTFMISSLEISWQSPNLAVILLGSAIRGVFGRSAIMTMAVYSYVSDHSSIQSRTNHFSNLIAMSNFGYLFGSSVSGILLERIGSSFVFLIVTTLNTVCVFIVYFLMFENKLGEQSHLNERYENYKSCETERLPLIDDGRGEHMNNYHAISTLEDFVILPLPDVDDFETPQPQSPTSATDNNNVFSPFDEEGNASRNQSENQNAEKIKINNDDSIVKKGNCIDNLSHILSCFSVLIKERPDKKHYIIWTLFLVIYLHQMNKSGESDIYLLFVRRYPLSVSKSTYGYLVSASYASLGLFAFSVPKILKFLDFQVKDSNLVITGITFKIGSLILLCFSQTVWMLVISAILTGVISIAISSLRSMVSKIIDHTELGRAFSLISSGETLFNFLGSLVYTSIYSSTANISPGLSFLVEGSIYAILMMIMIIISLGIPCFSCIRNKEGNNQKSTNQMNTESTDPC